MIIVDGFRPFAFVIGNSMLDLAGLLDLPLFKISYILGQILITSFCLDYVINFLIYLYASFYMHLFPLVN